MGKLRQTLLALAALLAGVTSVAEGATRTAASCSYEDVKAAYEAAADGDTIMIPAGTATWASSLAVNKGVTIRGAGCAETVITNGTSGTGSYAQPLFVLGDGGTGVRRIAGIGMRSTLVTNEFAKRGSGVWAGGYGTPKRIDHCRFDDLYCGVWVGNANGVSDHNTYYNVATATRHSGGPRTDGLAGQQYAWNKFRPLALDSLNYFFHENETIEMTGDSQVADEVEACSYAFRYSKITLREAHGPYTAAQSFSAFDVHGDNPASRQYSSLTLLLYENDITVNSGAAMSFLNLRGGSALVFNNRVVARSGSGGATAGVALWEERYRFADWPRWADPQYEDAVHNAYVWNNTLNGKVELPHIQFGQGHLVIAASPEANPAANCWTSAPTPVKLPPYPHPLVTAGEGPPNAAAAPSAGPQLPPGVTNP